MFSYTIAYSSFPRRSIAVLDTFVILFIKNNQLGPLGAHQSRIPLARSSSTTLNAFNITFANSRVYVYLSSKAKP
jgi:hypothetical protein